MFLPHILEYSSWTYTNVICYLTFYISFVSGFPLSIVAASLTVTVTGTKPYAMDNCWLTLEHGVIYWAFVGPVALVILVSIYRYQLDSSVGRALHMYRGDRGFKFKPELIFLGALFSQLVLFKLCTKQRWLSRLDYFSLLSRSTLFCLFSCCVA